MHVNGRQNNFQDFRKIMKDTTILAYAVSLRKLSLTVFFSWVQILKKMSQVLLIFLRVKIATVRDIFSWHTAYVFIVYGTGIFLTFVKVMKCGLEAVKKLSQDFRPTRGWNQDLNRIFHFNCSVMQVCLSQSHLHSAGLAYMSAFIC